MVRKPWTTTENTLLRELYKTTMTAQEIADQLGRTKCSVDANVAVLGIKRAPGWRTLRAEVFERKKFGKRGFK